MGTKNLQFSEADLENLISSVEGALQKANKLSKAVPPQDPEAEDQSAAPPAEAGPAAAAPAPAAAAPAPAAPMDQAAMPQDAGPAAPADAMGAPAPAGDAAAGAAPGEGELAQEAQPGQEGAPLSDEELNEIYQSMPPEELERHYMIIRQHLQSAYAKAEEGESGNRFPEGMHIQPEGERGAKQTTHDGPTGGNESAMGKNEEFEAMKAKIAQQDKALETITKAFEIMTKPSRKAVTGTIDYIRKSELDGGNGGAEDVSGLSKKEKVSKLGAISPASLSKAERDQVNAYILRDEFKDEVDKILSRGKK
jgi:hypothetical protein